MERYLKDISSFYQYFPDALDDVDDEVFLDNNDPDPSRDRLVVTIGDSYEFEEENPDYVQWTVSDN